MDAGCGVGRRIKTRKCRVAVTVTVAVAVTIVFNAML